MAGLMLPATPALATAKTTTARTTSAKPAPAKTTIPTKSSRLAAVKAAKAINYYPSTAGWSKMWSSFDATKVDADFAKAQALGATSVRAIVFPTTFGYPTPNPTYTAKLDTFVKLANTHGMTVNLTLFDWWDAYAELDESKAWATSLLKPYKDDPRITGVELQNEIIPTDTAAMTWARAMIPAVRTAFPTMPLTLSAVGEDGPAGLAKIKSALGSVSLDYYDYHFYGNAERALATIRQAQAAVAPAPIVIGETGMNTLENTEGEQAAFLARVFEAAKAAGVNSVSPWTLNDFTTDAIPASIVAGLDTQYNYGLYRTNGVAKPAAAVVKAEFTGTAMPASLTDNGFENATGQTPWRQYAPELGMATKTTTAAHTGTWSVSLSNTGKTSADTPSYRVAPIQPVQPGQKWHGEVWAKGNATTGTTQIAISWFDINDRWLGGADSTALPTGTTDWTKLTVDSVAPAGTASMQIHLKSGANTGTVWFDDVVIGQA
ncbi:glycosyl hydrolase [Actinoplanes sp. KI2]|uniref:cellulase family glycosylhydrolase n=1 Tax=Actinoplanes sp. KI2 TaxID=2983315 RepID=UPI0021D5D1F1|nr:cellulase family glycosylhydrolase [Actinoplanes sp. KI2]MCU7730044.1 glycosyl hydrolase [Actinoplanes sp. KI2]